MSKRILYIIGAFIALLLVSSFIFFINRTYSISDISADNYSKLLIKDPNSSFARLNYFFPQSFIAKSLLEEAKSNAIRICKEPDIYYPYGDNYEIRRIKDRSEFIVEVYEKDTYTSFLLYYLSAEGNSDDLKRMYIEKTNAFMRNEHGITEELIDNLLRNEQYVYKETNLKNGHDILVRETDDSFIIISVNKLYNGEKISSMLFEFYKRKKYFQSL